MTIYVTATSTRPTIVCPSWCEVTQEEHIADLENWDGMVVHQWHTVTFMQSPALDQFSLSAGVSLCVDGAPDPAPLNALSIEIAGRTYTPAEALSIADTIRALVYDVTEGDLAAVTQEQDLR